MFGELKEMKGLGYDLVPNQLMQILKDDNFKLFYTLKDDIPLCAQNCVHKKRNGCQMCCCQFLRIKKIFSNPFMMERIFDHLKEQGIKVFDFSRIPPSNNETDSVYVFKIVQEDTQYNIMESGFGVKKNLFLAFCVYNFFIRKAHQY